MKAEYVSIFKKYNGYTTDEKRRIVYILKEIKRAIDEQRGYVTVQVANSIAITDTVLAELGVDEFDIVCDCFGVYYATFCIDEVYRPAADFSG